MIKITNIKVMNLDGAFRGMRNPMDSWSQSDSNFNQDGSFSVGIKDLALAVKLVKSGSDHSKFMRQIFVCLDVESSLYFFKEFDTYKVGTVANSTSTMHKIHTRTLTDNSLYSVDKLGAESMLEFGCYCNYLEKLRQEYLKTKDKETWYQIIQMLPSNFNQMRTWTANYAILRNIYFARKNHKLDEWREFCKMIEKLPYSELITIEK